MSAIVVLSFGSRLASREREEKMKILALVAMVVGMETGAPADEVTVHVLCGPVVPAPVLGQAEALASEIFAGVGVKIDWRRGQPSRSQSLAENAIVVEMVTDTPMQFKPGALAFAQPYEGVHIDVFYDRVQAATEPALTPNV